MLNKKPWNHAGFHKGLAALASLSQGERALDLGSGRGATLEYLLTSVGPEGHVTALDRMERALSDIETRHSDEIRNGRLTLVNRDVGKTSFLDNSFDAVICQNVIECVEDREGLVLEIKRILRPGGRLVLGHHDFDGIIISSDDKDLTRRIVHGFADHKQNWQDFAEGRMGRMIPALAASGNFASVEIETHLFVDLHTSMGSYARDYLSWVEELSTQIGIEQETMTKWLEGLQASATHGRFFFGLPWMCAVCQK